MKWFLNAYVVIGLLYPAGISCQLSLEMLKPKHMEKDLEVMLETLDAHPDLYAKVDKGRFDQVVDSVRININVALDEIDFYKNMSSIVALIGDGHSQLYFPKNWLKDRYKEHGMFP